MTRARLALIGGGVLVALGALGAVALALLLRDSPAEVHPTSHDVPAVWRGVRDSAGHVNHVVYANVACRECHEPGKPFDKPPATLCRTCHDDVVTPLHASHARGADGPACTDCHGFGADREPSPRACMRCHDKAQGEVAAVGVHGREACDQCHQPHGVPATVARDCVECHAAERTRHGQVPGAQRCLDCHRPHEAANAADGRCVECHAQQRPIVAGARALFAGHDTCTGCHVPHKLAKDQVAACTGCHSSKHVLGQRAGAHRDCTSCHPQHDVRQTVACTRCHDRKDANHPAAPTTPSTASGVRTASRACLGCHPIHQPPDGGARAVACATCHAGHPGHAKADCTSCHAPHSKKPVLAPALCASCHPDRTRSTAGTGHARCLGCHTSAAHQPEAPRPACATCHAGEASTAPVGHQDCARCHADAVHAPRTPRPACASCHAPERARGHGAKLDCATCHRPHAGPSGAGGVARPPACATCHVVTALPGLHKVAKHQDCATCHRSHEAAPRADRATCLGCHADRANHEPSAPTCKGCHPFSVGTGGRATLRPGAAVEAPHP